MLAERWESFLTNLGTGRSIQKLAKLEIEGERVTCLLIVRNLFDEP